MLAADDGRPWPIKITTAAKHRLTRRLGILRGQDMDSVERALRVQLGLT